MNQRLTPCRRYELHPMTKTMWRIGSQIADKSGKKDFCWFIIREIMKAKKILESWNNSHWEIFFLSFRAAGKAGEKSDYSATTFFFQSLLIINIVMVLRKFMLHEILITEVMMHWPGGDVFFRVSKILFCFENLPASLKWHQIFVYARNYCRAPWDSGPMIH